jgi:hypothetical protein
MSWVSPDNFLDPDNAWNNEPNAYDGNTASYAETASKYDAGVWTPWLFLTFRKPVTSSKLRFYDAWGYHPYSDMIQIEVYKDGEWRLAYLGSTPQEAWQEQLFLTIAGFEYAPISMIRVRLEHDYPGLYSLRLYDVQLWRVEPERFTTKADCEAANYYWYNNACHLAPSGILQTLTGG